MDFPVRAVLVSRTGTLTSSACDVTGTSCLESVAARRLADSCMSGSSFAISKVHEPFCRTCLAHAGKKITEVRTTSWVVRAELRHQWVRRSFPRQPPAAVSAEPAPRQYPSGLGR